MHEARPAVLLRPARQELLEEREAGRGLHERDRGGPVTEHPTAAWTAQQLREARPWNDTPRFVVRDREDWLLR